MRQGQKHPVVSLVPVLQEDLPALERGLVPSRLGSVLSDGLPPPHVARRIRKHLDAGKPARWVCMYYILDADGCCIGGCGFKDVPQAGEVEIGYGLAGARRGHGFASAALSRLIEEAKAHTELDALVAHIAPDNEPSIRVATRAGFVAGDRVLDEGEWNVRYRLVLRMRVANGVARELDQRD